MKNLKTINTKVFNILKTSSKMLYKSNQNKELTNNSSSNNNNNNLKKSINLKKVDNKNTNLVTRSFEFDISKLMNRYEQIENKTKLNTSCDNLDLKIINLIKEKGPLSIKEYTQMCLFDPEFGYYSTKDYVFGNKGDFITAPEISQLFGECISIWLYKQLEEFGFPDKIDLLELGPGRGFLAIDVIRSFYNINLINNHSNNNNNSNNIKSDKEFNYYFVDMSSKLRKVQQENVFNCLVKLKLNPKYGVVKPKENKNSINNNTLNNIVYISTSRNCNFIWFSSIEDYISVINNKVKLSNIPDINIKNISVFATTIQENPTLNPLIIFANELFDALPINTFIYNNKSWKEKLITFNQLTNNLQFTLSDDSKPTKAISNYLLYDNNFLIDKISNNSTYEFSSESVKYMSYICMLLTQRVKSASLIIDYGEMHAFSNSFRGIINQKLIKDEDILKYSGKCDLSAYVNFYLLKKVCFLFNKLDFGGIIKQGYFLEYMGINNKVNTILDKNKNNASIEKSLNWQYNMLVNLDKMGETFKCFYLKKRNRASVYPFIPEILDNC